jgi:hypothetical protein
MSKCVKQRFGASEQQVAELGLAARIKANDLAIEHASATFQIASESLAQSGEALERVSVA